jgi:RNA polymerase sigma-70 factor (ECF subfamily)
VSAIPFVLNCTAEGILAENAGAAEGEAALIERAKTEQEALAAVYRRYQPRIAAYVVRRLGHTHEAEDLVANVFLAMVRGLKNYRQGEVPFVAWLYRIASNEINRAIRKRRIRSFFGLYTEIAAAAESSDEAEQLRVALSQLPLHYQTALSLHYLEDLSVNEVAAVIGAAPGTVKSRLARGRDLLKAKLSQLK